MARSSLFFQQLCLLFSLVGVLAVVGLVSAQQDYPVSSYSSALAVGQANGVSHGSNGLVVVLWSSTAWNDTNEVDIYARVASVEYDPLTGTKLEWDGAPYEINDSRDGVQDQPSIVYSGLNYRYLALWRSKRLDTINETLLMTQYLTGFGDSTGKDSTFHSVEGEVDQAKIATVGNAFVVAWKECEEAPCDPKTLKAKTIGYGKADVLELENDIGSGDISITSIGLDKFAVTWDDGNHKIWLRVYNMTGSPTTSKVLVTDVKNPNHVAVSNFGKDGDKLVISWERDADVGSGRAIIGRFFDGKASPTAAEFIVQPGYNNILLRVPLISKLDTGGFVISYHQETPPSAVRATRFNSTGSTIGLELKINKQNRDEQIHPMVISLKSCNFVSTWSAEPNANEYNVFAQIFDYADDECGEELWEPDGNSSSGNASILHPGPLMVIATVLLLFSLLPSFF